MCEILFDEARKEKDITVVICIIYSNFTVIYNYENLFFRLFQLSKTLSRGQTTPKMTSFALAFVRKTN
jgi:hypothetical protein